MYLYLHLVIEKFKIINTQTLKLFKKQFQILIGLILFRNKNANESCRLLTDTLTNVFRNYVGHKTRKFDYKAPEWINTLIISALKKRLILVKRYYRNPSEYNKEALINKSNECTKLLEAKQNYIAKMSSKLDCPDTASKTYWAIINKFLNKKKYQIYRFSFLTTSSHRIFIKKLNYLIDTLRNNAL